VLDSLLTPEQAATQAALIEQHLKGPDGARLFDAPLPYRGGPSALFQRAETSSFFGREIGIMYMHAHLRYAQMLAHLGRAEAFLQALMQAHPIALADRVPSASPRQANCYYSSSDAAFADRYVAQAEYGRVLAGEVALDGGWRIYSSGPGIALGLVIGSLLGLRLEHDALVVDPVMPPVLDGLTVQLQLADLRFELAYRVGPRGHGVARVLDEAGQELTAMRRPHAYRIGPLALARPVAGGIHRWTIELG
jgi:1,2-beta-oligoglucan phosphorylase